MTKKQEQPEPVMSTVEQLRAARLNRRAKAAARYRELLARNDRPESGDADALIEIMRTLGRSEADLEADIALVRALAASEDAQRQADALDKPFQEAKHTFHETQARVEQERVAFEQRVAGELKAVELSYRKLMAERHALQTVATQAPTDQWRAVVEGISTEEARQARRAARVTAAPTPAPVTRDDVIAQCRHEMLVLRYAPVSGTVVDRVNAELRIGGFEPLSDAEVARLGVDGWVTPRRGYSEVQEPRVAAGLARAQEDRRGE